MSLLVVGTVAFDQIETPFGKTDKIEGGAANYAALSAANFVDEIQLVSVVGDDFPTDYIKMLESKGVVTEGLQIKVGEKSFFWSGKYHNDMNSRDTLVTELNVLETFDPVLPASYQNTPFILLGNLAPVVQMRVLEQLTSTPKLVVLDTMNFWMDIAMDDLKKVIGKTDVLTINDEEARQLSGEYSLVKAARIIQDMGPKYLVIKKGEHGALLFHGDKTFFAPAMPLEDVCDPTGAGDTFAGAFIGYLAKHNTTDFEYMKRAVVYGSAMASFCVEEFGPKKMINLSEAEIDERMAAFNSLMAIDMGVSC